MSKLERTIYRLSLIEQRTEAHSFIHRLDARAKLMVLLAFLFCMLSLPTYAWQQMVLFFVYPIVTCFQAKIPYFALFRQSLFILPFVGLIGIFNPWPGFLGILIRGIASVQVVFLCIQTTGFQSLCKGMNRLGIPSLLVSQLLFVYRYLFVLIREALSMEHARQARSYGRRSYPLAQWGIFAGQLLLRTLNRSERLHQAMLSRGFDGSLPYRSLSRWRMTDTLYLLVWSLLFVWFRFLPLQSFLS